MKSIWRESRKSSLETKPVAIYRNVTGQNNFALVKKNKVITFDN